MFSTLSIVLCAFVPVAAATVGIYKVLIDIKKTKLEVKALQQKELESQNQPLIALPTPDEVRRYGRQGTTLEGVMGLTLGVIVLLGALYLCRHPVLNGLNSILGRFFSSASLEERHSQPSINVNVAPFPESTDE